MSVSAIFAEGFARPAVYFPGDPEATAAALLATPQLARLGLFGYFVAYVLDIPVSVLLYPLLRDTSMTGALFTVSARLVYTAVVMAALLGFAGALLAVDPARGLSDPAGIALLGMDVFAAGFALALAVFGVHLVALGLLLYRGRLVPRPLAALLTAGGASYVSGTVTGFLLPAVHEVLMPIYIVLGMVELLLAIWLVARGVRVDEG